jgi:hypothetical protein
VLDKVIPTDLTHEDVKRLFSRDPLELFEHIIDLVEDITGSVDDVKLHKYVINSNILIEYFAYTKYGRVLVRITCAEEFMEV